MNPSLDIRSTIQIDELVKLSYFTGIGKAIASARTIHGVLNEVMRQIAEIFAPLYWSVLLRNRKTGELTFKVVVGENIEAIRDVKIPRGEGVAGWIAEHGEPLIIQDVRKDRRFCQRVDQMTGFQTRSIIGVPLKSNGQVFGVIELINKLNGQPFSAYELKVLSTVADFAAIAIEKIYYLRAFHRLATMDALTGVYNRRSLERVLGREVERCRRYGEPLAALWVDVDDFKRINDQFGHLAGDQVLKRTARLLQAELRLVDTVYRYGGDEFIVLLPNTTREQAENVRARIQGRLARMKEGGDKPFPFTLSIGLHSAGPDGVDDILSFTDRDLYRQKDHKEELGLEDLGSHLDEFLREEEGEGEAGRS